MSANTSEWYSLVKKVCGLSLPSIYDKILSVPDYSNFNSKQVADLINYHFATMCNTYDGVNRLVLCPVPSNQSPLTVTQIQVNKLLTELNVKKSNVPGRIPVQLVKMSNCFIVPLLTEIINYSFETFSVPDVWKAGFITPLLK